MLSVEDNELISHVGPGTLMGNLMRQYWIPALLSSELPKPDSDPVRVMLLGEQLIAFRDTNGKVGLIANLCPHRGASLFFGRNEHAGLRCVYHGWKFDIEGNCVDMPNEPSESNFKDRIKAVTYPCQERNGLIWAYMGPRDVPPPLPGIEANERPAGNWSAYALQRECNWLQGLEGDIDTVHVGFLHGGHRRLEDAKPGTFSYYGLAERAPKYEALDTDYGSIYGAYRPAGPGEVYWRIAQFLFPFWAQTPTGVLGHQVFSRAWVPMDDGHVMIFGVSVGRGPGYLGAGIAGYDDANKILPNTTDWYGRFRYSNNAENDYLIDRERQRSNLSYSGIPGGGPLAEDQAITESMGSILDRTIEHLGSSDLMIIRVRRRLLDAAQALAENGATPPAVDSPVAYNVRSGGVILPEHVDWLEGIKDLLPAYVDHPELDLAIESGRAPV